MSKKKKKEKMYKCPCGCGMAGNNMAFILRTCPNRKK